MLNAEATIFRAYIQGSQVPDSEQPALMEYPFSLPDFEARNLAVRVRGMLNIPYLLVDGVEQRPTKRFPRITYSLTDDTGQTRRVALQQRLFDAAPSVKLDREKSRPIAPRLSWYECLWIGIPFVPLIACGCAGFVVGAFGLAANARVFRTRRTKLGRYGITGLISAVTIVLTIALGAVVDLVWNRL